MVSHGNACECYRCRWDLSLSIGNPNSPERAAYLALRRPEGAHRTLTEQWCGKSPQQLARPVRPGGFPG